jgi:outer membrane autotransporter protein
LQLSGQFAEIDSFQSLAGHDFSTAGALVGVDYRISRNSAIGVAIGYDYTDVDSDGGNDSTIDDGRISAYAMLGLGHGFFLNATAGAAFSSYDVDRPIRFSFIDRTAHGETEGAQAFAGLELGKDVHLDNWTITPSVGLQYTYLNINGFTESDAGVLGLTLDDFHAQSLCLEVGVQVSYRLQLTDRVRLTPYLNVYWQHELSEQKEEIRAALPADGGSFFYHGKGIGFERVRIGAGLFLEFRRGFTLNLGYQSELGDDDYTSHLIFIQASKSF